MFDVKKIRKDFPILNQKMQGHDLIYFDSGATSLKPNIVIQKEMEYYNSYCANAHRGDYDIAYKVDVEYESTRKVVADFINADKNEIVYTQSTTMSLNMIAFGYARKFLKKDDEILISLAEHASNVLPWYRVQEEIGCIVKFIELDENGTPSLDSLKKLLNPKVKIVSLAHVSNVLGNEIDVKSFVEETHKAGAIFVLDGAQSVPHKKIDVKELDVDFLAFSGHKMCGPTGIGVLYGKYELLDKMDSYFTGGGMNNTFDEKGHISYHPVPEKFEAGTPNIAGVVGLKAAILYLNSIGMENIEAYEEELKEYAVKKLKELDNVILYNPNSKSGIITFNIKNVFAQDAGSHFNKYGIAVRSGLHCAKLLPNFTHSDATVRASLYFYNTFEEIDAFVEACKKGGDFLDAFFA